jgi:hypothetical protein
LQSQHRIHPSNAQRMERQERYGVGLPALPGLWVDTGHPINPAFERAEQEPQYRVFATIDPGQMAAEGRVSTPTTPLKAKICSQPIAVTMHRLIWRRISLAAAAWSLCH